MRERHGNPTRTSELLECIKKALEDGLLKEQFTAVDVRKACTGFAKNTYPNFLPKHRIGNGAGYKEYFIQHKNKKYSLNPAFRS